MAGIIALAVLVIAGTAFILNLDRFGKLPTGERLEQIMLSPHYVSGHFENLEKTPIQVSDRGFIADIRDDLFNRREGIVPERAIPCVKTDLKNLDRNRDVMVWLGHSSYFLQLDGRRILVDPVFSRHASPVFFVNRAFPGSGPFGADDMPELDFLLISHDHWDHLDYQTVMDLRPKIKKIVTGLGVGSHFAHWGFPDSMIHEADWNTALQFGDLEIHVLPSRHFSGRSLWDNKTLWVAFALIGTEHRVFLSGDTGYGSHFKEIGESFGWFDVVSLDTGQYDNDWPYVHMNPEEAAQAAEDLRAKAMTPGHVGRFALANHAWEEPFVRITAASRNREYRLLTPIIGEPVYLDLKNPACPPWWETMQ